jgi:hypothetical protein
VSGLFSELRDRVINCIFIEVRGERNRELSSVVLPTDLLPRPGDIIDLPSGDGIIHGDFVVLGRRFMYHGDPRTCMIYVLNPENVRDEDPED